MIRFFFTITSYKVYSQNVGSGITTPTSELDLKGNFSSNATGPARFNYFIFKL